MEASQKNLKSKERKQLAEAIKVEAFKFANNPSDYGLVLPVEKLVWKMIEGSEGISSCTIPSYDLTRSMEILNATFLKRAEGDTYFTCNHVKDIDSAVRKVISSKERVNLNVPVTATVPDKFGEELVAEFTITLSMKEY